VAKGLVRAAILDLIDRKLWHLAQIEAIDAELADAAVAAGELAKTGSVLAPGEGQETAPGLMAVVLPHRARAKRGTLPQRTTLKQCEGPCGLEHQLTKKQTLCKACYSARASARMRRTRASGRLTAGRS